MAHKHRVFFKGQSWIPQDYFVNIIADTYERMRAVLLENFYFLRYRKFAVAERTDGTYVCDDEYYKSLQPDCDLVVLITDCQCGDVGMNQSLKNMIETSNYFISHLKILGAVGNVRMDDNFGEHPTEVVPLHISKGPMYGRLQLPLLQANLTSTPAGRWGRGDSYSEISNNSYCLFQRDNLPLISNNLT